MTQLILSNKFKAFMKHKASVEFLEGTTSAGKTTVGIVKFMFKVADSKKKDHVLSGLDLGTIERNIIQKELGILDIFGKYVTYRSNGSKDYSLPHILYQTPKGLKVIFVLGYDDKRRWKKALGGQYGCLYIDEINIADMEFVREIFMRSDYIMGTLNPDDPELPIYHEYINHSRPLPRFKDDAPDQINKALASQPHTSDWTHWFFGFDDNAALTEDKKQLIITNTPEGTKLYKNKILGLRGRAEGLVFPNFEYERNVISEGEARAKEYALLSVGVDTSYSTKSEDTIAFILQGISTCGHLVTLEEEVYSNKLQADKPFAPSDIATRLFDFLDLCIKKWGPVPSVYVDNADQATITEVQKLKRRRASTWAVIQSDKKVRIVDRINLMSGWMYTKGEAPMYLVVNTCNAHIKELNSYAYEANGKPEDRNDHTINASQYAWIPYRDRIGYATKKSNTKQLISKLKKFGL